MIREERNIISETEDIDALEDLRNNTKELGERNV